MCKTVEDDVKYHINLVTNDKDRLVKNLLIKYKVYTQLSLDLKKLDRRKEEIKVILKRMYEDISLYFSFYLVIFIYLDYTRLVNRVVELR